ncbi:MAG: hypothetical protein ACFFAS_06215 [Promethearchaeota archaeon]
MQSLLSSYSVNVIETRSLSLIKNVLIKCLEIPDKRLKPNIVEELTSYIRLRFLIDNFQIKVFIAYREDEAIGFVISQLDPHYKSYGRKCATFGWLTAPDLETCKCLLKKCENFAKSKKFRRIRGNINFPKGIGGFGVQTHGFDQRLLYGVPFKHSKIKTNKFLVKCGYKPESLYTCMKVSSRVWKSGKKPPSDIRFDYLTFKELKDRKNEILELARNSFYSILPDTYGGEERFDEILKIQSQIPSRLFKLNNSINFKELSKEPLFLEAWKNFNLKKIAPLAPIAVNRKTGEIAGILLGIPDLYETWLGKDLTRVNIDTAMISKDYNGKGIFSALNNIGQMTCRLFGITYFEGTSIWFNNMAAVNSIFPHSNIVRKHIVFEKIVK